MEEDISNYSPTFMFRGTPCSKPSLQYKNKNTDETKIKTVAGLNCYFSWTHRVDTKKSAIKETVGVI